MNDPKNQLDDSIKKFLEHIVIKHNLKLTMERALTTRYCQRCEEPRFTQDFENPLGVCDICFEELSVEERWMLTYNLCEDKE